MAVRDDQQLTCPVARAAALVGDTYVLLIVRDLASGPKRFGDLERSVAVNPRTLTSRLRQMEAEGLVDRQVFPEIPPRVEYRLTAKGRALAPIVEALRRYGEEWLALPAARQASAPHDQA